MNGEPDKIIGYEYNDGTRTTTVVYGDGRRCELQKGLGVSEHVHGFFTLTIAFLSSVGAGTTLFFIGKILFWAFHLLHPTP